MHTALNKTLAALPDETKVYVSFATISAFATSRVMTEQPGHEYTKQNVKFLTTVLQTEPVKNLQRFAENNQQTQGKFTIGDEKVSLVLAIVDS